MRALPRRLLVPLALAAALFSAGAPAAFAATAAHPGTKYISQDCPAGTNWDNTTQSCVP